MCRETVVRVLLLGLVTASLMFVLAIACGGTQEEPKPHPLPVFDQELRPGYYRSQEFEPSVIFKVGEGWRTEPPELLDNLLIVRGNVGGLGFANAREVYEPAKSTLPSVMEAPDDTFCSWPTRPSPPS